MKTGFSLPTILVAGNPNRGYFLHAAKALGFYPDDFVVIEDSAAGIIAALAVDFKVYALTREKKKRTFEQMGAIPFESMKELEKLLQL